MWFWLWACARVPADLDLPVALDAPADGACISALLHRDDADRRAAQSEATRALGVRVVRQDVRWASVQPTRDTWDWTREDAVVDAVYAADAEMIAMLAYGNPWATSVPDADEFYPPDDPADFARFAGEAAARYGDRVRRYEIWNEPNSGFRFWKQDPPAFSGDPVAYAALFVAAADAIHAVDPELEVMIGGTFWHEQGIIGGAAFLEAAIAAEPELLAKADAIAFHPYPLYPPRVPPEDGEGDEKTLAEMIAEVRAVGGDLPVVITEFGWPSWDTVDEDEQAAWLARSYLIAHTEGVRDVCWYTLEDQEDPDGNPEDAFGLTRLGATERKPAGDAYARLFDAMPARAYGYADDALALPDGVWATRYADDDRVRTAVWTVDDNVPIELPRVGGCDVTIDGAPVDGRGPVEVVARPAPVFVDEPLTCR